MITEMGDVNVTKSFLPPLEEYEKYLEKIWQKDYLTNQGPLLLEFEAKAKEYLDVENFHFVTNGTLALQLALRAVGITGGEVITTPFSYVATTSTILWEHCNPVFVDIEPETFCIDADKIEAAITPNTKAIMAVHVFGFPCDVEKIQAIADKHGLKVIYDGAHAFGVKYKGKSLLSYGDLTMCSFHATKVFHTIEGGSLTMNSKDISDKVELLKRFGHNNDEHYMLGINAKASEFQAAMGLCNLKYIDSLIENRKRVFNKYNELLGEKYARTLPENTQYNYAYYPVLLDDEELLLDIISALRDKNIFPRRYFYPSLNTLPYLNGIQACPRSEDIARRIMCIPFYPDIPIQAMETISKIIKRIA